MDRFRGGFVRSRVEPGWVGTMGGGYISRKMVWVSGDIYLHRLEPEYIYTWGDRWGDPG